MSKDGAGPWSSGRAPAAQLVGVPRGGGVRVVTVRAVAGRHRVHPGRVERDGVEQRLRGPAVSLRSGSPAGRNRSSPHHTSSRDQSTAPRAEDDATASSVITAMPPAGQHQRRLAARRLHVDQPGDQPRGDGGAPARPGRGGPGRSAGSRGPPSAVDLAAVVFFMVAFFAVAFLAAVVFLAAAFFVGLRRSAVFLAVAFLAAGLPARIGSRQMCSRLAGRASRSLLAGRRRQRVGVRLVGVQPAQLLGDQVAEAAALERQLPVRHPGAVQRREVAVRPVDAQPELRPEPDLDRGDAGPVRAACAGPSRRAGSPASRRAAAALGLPGSACTSAAVGIADRSSMPAASSARHGRGPGPGQVGVAGCVVLGAPLERRDRVGACAAVGHPPGREHRRARRRRACPAPRRATR